MEIEGIFAEDYIPRSDSAAGQSKPNQSSSDLEANAEAELNQAASEEEAKPKRTTIRIKLLK